METKGKIRFEEQEKNNLDESLMIEKLGNGKISLWADYRKLDPERFKRLVR